MQETRTMRFEAQKQAILDLNKSTDNIIVPATPEVLQLLTDDSTTMQIAVKQVAQ